MLAVCIFYFFHFVMKRAAHIMPQCAYIFCSFILIGNNQCMRQLFNILLDIRGLRTLCPFILCIIILESRIKHNCRPFQNRFFLSFVLVYHNSKTKWSLSKRHFKKSASPEVFSQRSGSLHSIYCPIKSLPASSNRRPCPCAPTAGRRRCGRSGRRPLSARKSGGAGSAS